MNHSNRASAGPLVATLREFMQLESAGGILLLATAVLAMLLANSPLAGLYDALLDTPVAVQIGALAIDKPLLLWINDGLMAVFFFLAGLAFEHGSGDYFAGDRLGILLGSVLSALAALAVLHLSLPRRANGVAETGEGV